MTPFRLTLAAAMALWGAQAMAQDAPTVQDTDGNGTYSLAEIQAAYPDATAETFAKIDTNGDASVSAEELAAAIADGVLKPQG